MSTEFYDNEGNIAFLRYYGGAEQGMCIDFFTRKNRDRVLDLYVRNTFFDSEGCASLTFTLGFSDMDKNLEHAHWVYRDEKEDSNSEFILCAMRRNVPPTIGPVLVKECDPELERLLAEEEEIERAAAREARPIGGGAGGWGHV